MSKSSKILIAVLIFLGAVYAVQRFTSTNSTTETSKPFDGVDTAKITDIAIHSGVDLEMSRQDKRWMITSPVHFPVSSGQISLFLSRIASDPVASVVAENLSDSSAYGLDASAISLQVMQSNGKKMALRVGNVTPDFDGCYVQIAGSDKVLNLSTNLRSLAGESLTDWRDKKVFNFREDDISNVDISVGDTLYHFFHSDTLWRVNGTEIPATEAQSVLDELVGTNAYSFIDSTVNVTEPMVDYGFTLANREHVAGRIFKLADKVCLTNSANNQVYVVSSTLPTDLEESLRMLKRDYLTN